MWGSMTSDIIRSCGDPIARWDRWTRVGRKDIVAQLRQDIGEDQPHGRVVCHQDHCQIGAATNRALSSGEAPLPLPTPVLVVRSRSLPMLHPDDLDRAGNALSRGS